VFWPGCFGILLHYVHLFVYVGLNLSVVMSMTFILLCAIVYAVDGPVVLGVCYVSCYNVSPLLLAVGWIIH
jgi:hypothetical protein